ncbi:flavin reductase family protein [Massilia rhizosphaerae]|uniref:flavin reductase family protein n=1 Tax=Massilia rhizosphaerae TaxID=2784389 RepID=UPI0018DCA7F7|nr:flavin reductase family protein [Massilia rhizosphaerae]
MSTLASPTRPHAQLRAALGMFPTGVTIVTTAGPEGRPMGLTVNSFNAVSLDPPLVAWSLNNGSRSRAAFERADAFAIHVLAAGQQALAQRFAAKLDDPFDQIGWRGGCAGVPLIDGAAAVFECRVHARVDGGDHVLYLGRVERFNYQLERAPLVFASGRFCHSPLPLSD